LRGEATALGNLGAIYDAIKDYKQAIDYYCQSLSIMQEIEERWSEANLLGNLGLAYYNLGDSDKAIDFQVKSLSLMDEVEDVSGKLWVLGCLGNSNSALKKYDQAVDYYKERLILSRSTGNKIQEIDTLLKIGITLRKNENYSKSLQYLQIALDTFSDDNYNTELRSKAFKALAETYQRLDQYQLALKYCDRALTIAIELGIPLAQDCQKLKEGLLYDQSNNS